MCSSTHMPSPNMAHGQPSASASSMGSAPRRTLRRCCSRGAAGATTPESSSLLLFSFVAGLVISNSLVAVFSVAGLVSARVKWDLYLVIGVLTGAFSLLVGAFFLVGRAASLPDLQGVLKHFTGR